MSEGNGVVTWAAFYRCVIAAIAFSIGMAGGVVAWEMAKARTDTWQTTEIGHHETRIVRLENMGTKVDSILAYVRPKPRGR